MRLKRTASMTDIHFGRKNNSDQHNQDCLNYVAWFCERVIEDGNVDSVVFMGDWFENRNSIDIRTMHYSHMAAKLLNSLKLPIFFCVGNHDLYQRHTRDIFSTAVFHEMTNITVIQEPLIEKRLGDGALICPYLFHDEYEKLDKFAGLDEWWGHFEFRGFLITGYNTVMMHGPSHENFTAGPRRIFSGHFHRRQIRDNIVYTGNTFPMDFGDAGDNARGMMIYDHDRDVVKFIDWVEGPTYVNTKLSTLLEGLTSKLKLPVCARIRCAVDEAISFEDSNQLRVFYIKKFKLRELTMRESVDIADALENTDVSDLEGDGETIASVDDTVAEMLQRISIDQINGSVLLDIYRSL